MTIKLSADISITDIPSFLQNDFSIYKNQLAPIISRKQYKQWISTRGTCAVIARNNSKIIGQMWAHPLRVYQDSKPVNNHFSWMHNIKVHPSWQNRGIYKEIEEYYHKNIYSEDEQQVYLINAKNSRMRHLARKSRLLPILNVPGTILFRYFFTSRPKLRNPLKVTKSFSPPKALKILISDHKMFWIPRFSWDNSPLWFNFYFKDKLVSVLQVTNPIHPVQGKFIKNFPIILHTFQIRYISFSSDILQLYPSISRSIFTYLFDLFPHINGFIFTLTRVKLAQLLRFPRFLIPSYDFILYSTKRSQEMMANILDFRQSFIPLNSDTK